MFGDHKSHQVSPLDAAYESLQSRIGNSLTSGALNPKQISGTIFEVKHALFLCVQEREKLRERVKSVFAELRSGLDARERELEGVLDRHSQENIDRLSAVEAKWTRKYEVALELMYLVESLEKQRITPKDLIVGAHGLYQKLELLEEPVRCEEATLLSGASFSVDCGEGGGQLSHEALLDKLGGLGAFPDSIKISYKA